MYNFGYDFGKSLRRFVAAYLVRSRHLSILSGPKPSLFRSRLPRHHFTVLIPANNSVHGIG